MAQKSFPVDYPDIAPSGSVVFFADDGTETGRLSMNALVAYVAAQLSITTGGGSGNGGGTGTGGGSGGTTTPPVTTSIPAIMARTGAQIAARSGAIMTHR